MSFLSEIKKRKIPLLLVVVALMMTYILAPKLRRPQRTLPNETVVEKVPEISVKTDDVMRTEHVQKKPAKTLGKTTVKKSEKPN